MSGNLAVAPSAPSQGLSLKASGNPAAAQDPQAAMLARHATGGLPSPGEISASALPTVMSMLGIVADQVFGTNTQQIAAQFRNTMNSLIQESGQTPQPGFEGQKQAEQIMSRKA